MGTCKRTRQSKSRWSDLSPGLKGLIIGLGIVQVGMIGVAHGDISRRPESEIRGPKRLWRLLTLINFAGPAAYFVYGRQRPDAR